MSTSFLTNQLGSASDLVKNAGTMSTTDLDDAKAQFMEAQKAETLGYYIAGTVNAAAQIRDAMFSTLQKEAEIAKQYSKGIQG